MLLRTADEQTLLQNYVRSKERPLRTWLWLFSPLLLASEIDHQFLCYPLFVFTKLSNWLRAYSFKLFKPSRILKIVGLRNRNPKAHQNMNSENPGVSKKKIVIGANLLMLSFLAVEFELRNRPSQNSSQLAYKYEMSQKSRKPSAFRSKGFSWPSEPVVFRRVV